MRIGILGGTFDPVHSGHLLVAEMAMEADALDEIWFIPASSPPHKDDRPGADASHRWAMLNLAIESNPRFRALDWEMNKGGISYSIDTVKYLIAEYPDVEFSWLIGADMVQYLPKWHRINELCQLIHFVGFARAGTKLDLPALGDNIRESVRIVAIPQADISSTDIRRRCGLGRTVRYLVPDAVAAYIKEMDLYGT